MRFTLYPVLGFLKGERCPVVHTGSMQVTLIPLQRAHGQARSSSRLRRPSLSCSWRWPLLHNGLAVRHNLEVRPRADPAARCSVRHDAVVNRRDAAAEPERVGAVAAAGADPARLHLSIVSFKCPLSNPVD